MTDIKSELSLLLTDFLPDIGRMLQRIQSIYLLLASLCLGGMFFFPIAKVGPSIVLDTSGASPVSAVPEANSTIDQLTTLLPFPIGYVVIGLLCLLIFSIFQYANRKRQMILCRIGYVLILGLVVLVYLTIGDLIKTHSLTETSVTYGVSTYLPIGSLVFLFLANRAIRKDEELVRSLERLR